MLGYSRPLGKSRAPGKSLSPGKSRALRETSAGRMQAFGLGAAAEPRPAQSSPSFGGASNFPARADSSPSIEPFQPRRSRRRR